MQTSAAGSDPLANGFPTHEEDSLCRAACGLSYSELITKAIQNQDSLTANEARLVTAGVIPNQAGRLLDERLRLSPEERDLVHKANAAATTEEMKAAIASAQAVSSLTVQWLEHGHMLSLLEPSTRICPQNRVEM